jgi:hypothetical protein
MTAERYGPTLPTGGYPVADHALGSWPPSVPGDCHSHSADCRECGPGTESVTTSSTIIFHFNLGDYRRSGAEFRGSAAGRGGSAPAARRPHRPRSSWDIAAQKRRRPVACAPPGSPAARAAADPGRRSGEAPLRIPFLSSRTELSADRCVLAPKGRRPNLGGGVQSHMGYHGEGGRRVAMWCQLAFHAIAQNNSAAEGKSGRRHA